MGEKKGKKKTAIQTDLQSTIPPKTDMFLLLAFLFYFFMRVYRLQVDAENLAA